MNPGQHAAADRALATAIGTGISIKKHHLYTSRVRVGQLPSPASAAPAHACSQVHLSRPATHQSHCQTIRRVHPATLGPGRQPPNTARSPLPVRPIRKAHLTGPVRAASGRIREGEPETGAAAPVSPARRSRTSRRLSKCVTCVVRMEGDDLSSPRFRHRFAKIPNAKAGWPARPSKTFTQRQPRRSG